MSALGQKRTFDTDQANVRITLKADIPRVEWGTRRAMAPSSVLADNIPLVRRGA
jgi:hypothetical protein